MLSLRVFSSPRIPCCAAPIPFSSEDAPYFELVRGDDERTYHVIVFNVRPEVEGYSQEVMSRCNVSVLSQGRDYHWFRFDPPPPRL